MKNDAEVLDITIRHARSMTYGNDAGSEEQDQIAVWLEELRDRRLTEGLLDSPMVDGSQVKPFSRWKHRKGGTYIVVGIGNGCGGILEGKPLVIYEDSLTRILYIRGLAEFLDGRFTPDL